MENICDVCNQKLTQRKDDTVETFKNRYDTYLKSTAPLIQFYEEKGLLHKVLASKPNEEIIQDVVELVKGEKND